MGEVYIDDLIFMIKAIPIKGEVYINHRIFKPAPLKIPAPPSPIEKVKPYIPYIGVAVALGILTAFAIYKYKKR